MSVEETKEKNIRELLKYVKEGNLDKETALLCILQILSVKEIEQ